MQFVLNILKMNLTLKAPKFKTRFFLNHLTEWLPVLCPKVKFTYKSKSMLKLGTSIENFKVNPLSFPPLDPNMPACLSNRALTRVNKLELTWAWYLLLWFTIVYSLLKMECAAVIVRLRGLTNQFRYIIIYRKRTFTMNLIYFTLFQI